MAENTKLQAQLLKTYVASMYRAVKDETRTFKQECAYGKPITPERYKDIADLILIGRIVQNEIDDEVHNHTNNLFPYMKDEDLKSMNTDFESLGGQIYKQGSRELAVTYNGYTTTYTPAEVQDKFVQVFEVFDSITSKPKLEMQTSISKKDFEKLLIPDTEPEQLQLPGMSAI